jgi:hypothetical protein
MHLKGGKNMPYGFINDRAAKLLLTDINLRDYVCLIISKLLKLNYNYVKNNLELVHNGVNKNQNIKGKDTDALFENDYSVINFEFNTEYKSAYIIKNNMYVFHLYLRQLKPGEKENKIKPIYQKGEFIYKTQLCETTYHCIRDNNLVIYDINMDFLKKLSYNEIDGMPSDSLEKLFLVFYNREDFNYEQFYDGNPIMERVIKRLEEMWENFDDMLYYDVEKLRKAADDEAMKETIEKQVAEKVEKREKEITKEITQKVTDEVTVAIALKMIKDGLSKQQVINYLQITEEEYETLKRKVFDK